MEAFKKVGWGLLGIATFVAMLFVAALSIYGMAWVSVHVLEYLVPINDIVAVVCIVLLLPLALFRKTRIVPAYGLYVASFVFGVCVWMYGFIVTYSLWGVGGVFIGLMLGIVGIVPLGIIAASWHSEWEIVASLIFGLVTTYGARATAFWLWVKIERYEEEKLTRSDTIGAGDQQRQPVKSLLIDTGTGTSPVATVTAGSIEDAFAAHHKGDYATALRLFRPLADQRDARAQFVLGTMHANGEGVQQNYAAAMMWYRLSADQGYVRAQTNIGRMYSNGEGVAQNHAEAVKWWLKAANQGFAHAQHDVGLMYDKGLGVTQDYGEAAKWYRLAADQGDGYAQGNLGVLYAQGLGVPQDHVLAYKWFNLAAAAGSQSAANNRDHAARLMTAAQIAEAQKLAREWKPTKQSPR